MTVGNIDPAGKVEHAFGYVGCDQAPCAGQCSQSGGILIGVFKPFPIIGIRGSATHVKEIYRHEG